MFIVIFFTLASCNKNTTRPCTNGGYSFAITSEWSPQREVYQLGDTIYLTSVFSKTLHDLRTPSTVIDYSNTTGVAGGGIFYEMDTVQQKVIDAAEKFNFFSINGAINTSATAPTFYKDLKYKEEPDVYSFKAAVILKTKGLFAIFIVDAGCQGIKGKNCTNAGFENILTNTDKHINLFEYALGRPASQYEMERVYCLRVQ